MKKYVHYLRQTIIAAVFLSISSLVSAETIVITDNGGAGTGTTTWTADNTYILQGFVFVNSGQTLTIEPGTVIKGAPGTGAEASALIVAKGGKIIAEGTPENPIIFTFEADPLDGSVNPFLRGQWGGLLILGNAGLNSSPGVSSIEGIPTNETRGQYGGDNDEDNSGILRYVSIRHGGSDIGAGNEINGLTLGGVGRGTILEHIEVISNNDDGIEFFGGTAELKWAVVAFCGDDSFDYDEGWRGKGQFWFVVQDPQDGDFAGEHDGGTDPEDGNPYAIPNIYNATYIGRGLEADNALMVIRDNAGGFYRNSIFANFSSGLSIEKLASGEDSYNRFMNNQLGFYDNLFFNVSTSGTSATAEDLFAVDFGSGASDAGETANFIASFEGNSNLVADPGITYTISVDGGLNPVPSSDAVLNAPAPTDSWFEEVTYRGAFEPGNNWALGWSALDQYGFMDATSGIADREYATLGIYPNPTTDVVNIVIESAQSPATIEVIDLTGKVVMAVQNINLISGMAYPLNVAHLNRGVYIIRMIQEGKVSTSKISKINN